MERKIRWFFAGYSGFCPPLISDQPEISNNLERAVKPKPTKKVHNFCIRHPKWGLTNMKCKKKYTLLFAWFLHVQKQKFSQNYAIFVAQAI